MHNKLITSLGYVYHETKVAVTPLTSQKYLNNQDPVLPASGLFQPSGTQSAVK